MGQTDVASLLYADDANALSFTPMACKVDGLHPHLAQQMADAGNFTKKQGDGISQEGESCSAMPAKDLERLDTAAC
jgi:hypothetical protein